jgi:hypothetical protein
MSEEQRRILQMVQDGILSAAEADELLRALEDLPGEHPGQDAVEPPAPEAPDPVRVTTVPPDEPDDTTFRRYWEIPVTVGVGLLATSGICLLWSGTVGLFGLGVLCLWSLFLLAGLIVLIGFWSRTARWVHIRVSETDGDRLRISLPLPLGMASWGIRIGQRFVDEETRSSLDMAAGLLSMVTLAPGDDPISVEVDEDDGDHIQVIVA